MKTMLILLAFSPLFLTAQTTFKVYSNHWIEVHEKQGDSLSYVWHGDGMYIFRLRKFTERVDLVVFYEDKEYQLILLASDRKEKIWAIWKPENMVLNIRGL